ncbi:hypothetical protein AG0111_0g11814 [Alternaria gaisen]|uniref:Uncharacterized protein n=1 Tax=Alternaria gaisen TaxID=167740 RepID=A0ACB6F6N0_9PLEO|nr:hypothetical protein AG0111_0g11814 [Alternaria gaisen]
MAASTITQFFALSSSETSESDNIILAAESIDPRRDPEALIQPDEFKLQEGIHPLCGASEGP